MITGWGKTNRNIDKLSPVLKELPVAVLSRAMCGDILQSLDMKLHEGNICAFSNEGSGNCQVRRDSNYSLRYENIVRCLDVREWRLLCFCMEKRCSVGSQHTPQYSSSLCSRSGNLDFPDDVMREEGEGSIRES